MRCTKFLRRAWAIICNKVASGEISATTAKVSTKTGFLGMRENLYTICVYTYNYLDKEYEKRRYKKEIFSSKYNFFEKKLLRRVIFCFFKLITILGTFSKFETNLLNKDFNQIIRLQKELYIINQIYLRYFTKKKRFNFFFPEMELSSVFLPAFPFPFFFSFSAPLLIIFEGFKCL
jgi:hypothetical protein